MDSKLAQQHDDVYAAVFSLVGQKPSETYEGLVKVLPSIKDADPTELKELKSKKVLREMLKPHVDPLRLEYENAAAEEDVDDLSTDEGDWLRASKTGEDDEELDENGIPVMKLSRASSSFILDGPGDVKVDNFTPEGDGLATDGDAGGEGSSGLAAVIASTGQSAGKPTNSSATAASPAPTAATAAVDTAAASVYVPSAIARARRESGPGGGAAATTPARAAGPGPPVMTLEDEIRAMRAGGSTAAAAAAGTPSTAAAAADTRPCVSLQPGTQQQQQPMTPATPADSPGGAEGRRGTEAAGGTEGAQGGGDDDDAAEVVPEPSRAPRLLGGCDGDGEGQGTAAAPLGGPGLVPVMSDAAAAEGATLPGTCLDTRHEDSLWAAMQGVDGRSLLEHLGLAGPPSATVDTCDADEGEGEAAQPGNHVTAPALENGHHHHAEGIAAAAAARVSGTGTGSSQGDGGAGGARGSAAQSETAGGLTDEASGGSTTLTVVRAATPTVNGPFGAAAAAAGAEAAGGSGGLEAVGNGDAGAPMTAGREVVLLGSEGCGQEVAGAVVRPPARAPFSSSTSAEGPTFEEVESFRLDPNFDYDNVQLTVREFPYSLIGARVQR